MTDSIATSASSSGSGALELVVNLSRVRSGVWLAFGLTFPLLAVNWLRVGVVGQIAIPMVVIAVWLAVELLATLAGTPVKPVRAVSFVVESALALVFLLWHVVAAMRATDVAFALAELLKLTLAVTVMLTIVSRMPRDRALMERMWHYTVVTSTVMLGFLLYQSVVVLGSPYLVSELGVGTKVGKNQLSWYLNFFMPFALAHLVRTRRWHSGFALAVLGVGWIYVSSRSAWITVVGALLTMAWVARKVRARQPFRLRFVVALVFVGLITGAAWNELSKTLIDNEVMLRLTSIFNPAGVEKYNRSYEVRGARVEESIQLFLQSPFLGIGLTNQKTGVIGFPHNDYSGLLAETGIIGLVLFVAVLASVGWRLRPSLLRRVWDPSWVGIAYRGVYIAIVGSMVFTDTYTTLSLWVFFGVALVWSEIETLEAAAQR